jgi:hypothetical protein
MPRCGNSLLERISLGTRELRHTPHAAGHHRPAQADCTCRVQVELASNTGWPVVMDGDQSHSIFVPSGKGRLS